jgi:DNA-binding response OmpR family regulator
MPGLSGPQLARQLSVLHPETRVLYVSGYANDPLLGLESAGRDVELVAKPYSGITLLTRVRELLDAGRPTH